MLGIGSIIDGIVFKAYEYRVFFKIVVTSGQSYMGTVPEEEFFWSTEDNKNYNDVFKIGSSHKLQVLAFNKDKYSCNILLSRRFVNQKTGQSRDPWLSINKYYSVGDEVIGEIFHIFGNHAYCVINEGIKGIINVKNLTDYLLKQYEDSNKETPLSGDALRQSEVLYKGDYIAGKISNIDTNKRLVVLDVIAPIESRRNNTDINDALSMPAQYDGGASVYHSNIKHDLGFRNVCFIDDDMALVNMVNKVFHDWGIKFVTFTDYESISDYAQKESISNIDLFFVDLKIGQNAKAGIEISNLIKDNYPDAKIIIMTAIKLNMVIDDLNALGIQDVLLKPFCIEELFECIRIKGSYLSPTGLRKTTENEGAADGQTTLSIKIRDYLKILVELAGADGAAIFSYDPHSEFVGLISWNNDRIKEGYNKWYKYLHKSPIRDILMRGERFESNNKNPFTLPGKFRYLCKLLDFQRIIGKEINVPSEIGYCYFLFYSRRKTLSEIDYANANIGQAEIRNLLMEENYIQWAKDKQKFSLEGELLTQYGHSLFQESSALEGNINILREYIFNKSKYWDISDKEISNVIDCIQMSAKRIVNYGKKLTLISSEKVGIIINIEEFLNTIIDFARHEATSKDIIIRTRYCGNMPNIKITKMDLFVVILNVMVNAIQQISWFINKIGEIVVSTIYHSDCEYPIVIEISDNAVGVHRKNFDCIFEPLYTTRRGGHGMGLAIAKQELESEEAYIKVKESIMYRGTAFEIDIPNNLIL